MALTIDIINNVRGLFKYKHWDLSNGEGKLFDNFCKRLEIIPNLEDQKFIIELSRDFLCVEMVNVYENIQSVFFNISEDIYNRYDKITILPLSESICGNSQKTKSGQAYFYFLKSSDFFTWFDYFPNKFQFSDIININYIHPKKALFLIDDYVGSGETVKDIFLKVKSLYPTIDPNNFYVLAPYAQEAGIKYLKSKYNITVFTEVLRNKGITDNYKKELVPLYVHKMENIEDLISPKIKQGGLSLGFKRGEALIRLLNKTPNNTFPFYWFDTSTLQSPFPRRIKL